MSKDRLSQIWDGFEQTTTVDLSGTSVNSTPRPSVDRRAGESAMDLSAPITATATPEGQANPVGAALSAMHQAMADAPKGRGRQRQQAQQQGMAAAPLRTPPISNVERTLLADLAFTESKVSRSGQDYLSYASERQNAWQRRRRKKFLGIF